jgi:hypothetical protein
MARSKSSAPAAAPSPVSLAPLLQRIMELQGKPDPTDAEQAELTRLETEWSNHWLADPHDIPSRSAEAQSSLMDAVEDQRAQLRSVLGSVRCLETALQAQNPPDSDELGGALALAREGLADVIDALDEVNLLREVRKAQPDVAEESPQ